MIRVAPISVLVLLALAACGKEEPPPPLSSLVVRAVAAESGEPLAGMHVYLVERGQKPLHGETGADGTYDFGILVPGTYSVLAGKRAAHRQPRRRDGVEVSGPTSVTMELERYEGFRVRIVVPEGRPLPAKVTLRDGDARSVSDVRLDARGEGHTMAIEPGVHDLEFRVPGYPFVRKRVTVPRTGVEPVEVEVGLE